MDSRSIEEQDIDIIENAAVGLREIWKKKLLIALITIAGLIASVLVIVLSGDGKKYHASATLFSAVYGSYSDTTEGVAVMNRYKDLISSSRVCNRAAQTLAGQNITAEEIKGMVDDGYITLTGAGTNAANYGYQLTLNIYAESEDLAIPLTKAMASAYTTELNELIGSDMIQVMDEPTSYKAYRKVSIFLYIVLFGGGAFAVSCIVIFMMAFFSPWVRSAVQCEQNQDLILGMIPYSKERS